MKQALLLLVFAGFVLLLSGCSNIKGVTISDAERAVCEARGCGVWTMDQIRALFIRGAQAGYEKGYKDGKELL